MKSLKKSLLALTALVFIAFAFADKIVEFYIDWLWFESQGLESVIWTFVTAQYGFGIFAGGLIFLLNFVVLKSAYARTQHLPLVISDRLRREMPLIDLIAGNLKLFVFALPLVLAVMTGALAGENWDVIMMWWNRVPFDKADPVFGLDYSFYLFTLPFLLLVKIILWMLLMATAIGTCAIYFFKRSAYAVSTFSSLSAEARQTFSMLASLAFLMMAFGYYLDRFGLLTHGTGVVAGIGFAAYYGRLPALNLSIVVALLGALISFFNSFKFDVKKISLAAVLLGLVHIGGGFYPSILKKFVVDPNELIKETQFIEHTIAGTRLAYGLADVEINELTGAGTLTEDVIQRNPFTTENIRLWDQEPLRETLAQIQEIRTYYQFPSVDNDRYTINGNYRQTLLSARELMSSSLPNRTWINEHLTFTHGYGVSLSPVNQVTPEGLPVLFIKDIPPQSNVDLKVTRPEIYFGELANDYVFVNTETKEFDYPEGEKNVYKNYEGKGGIPVSSLFRKALLAMRFKTMKILFAEDITTRSRLLMNRDITTMVNTVTPFLSLDHDPYMVISKGGRLFWIYDAYTTSDQFPYSQKFPIKRFGNYIRNSVKVVIDAYNGSMDFYIADPGDPIIRTYGNIFPGLFKDIKSMPEDLRKHVRYPSDLFSIQTYIYATYHMAAPQVFYNKEDQWEIPKVDDKAMQPYYTIMKLPGKEHEEYILMLPFTPRGKSNLSAWMVARSDDEHYGQMVVYTFPKQKLVYGPSQIIARINQDAEISRLVSLWDQRGSKVILGTLLVIPIEESLIYVRPLYLKAEVGNKIPELKRVIVGYEDQIAMEPTLEQALDKIFGGRLAVSRSEKESAPPKETAAHATVTADESKVALKQSDYQKIKELYQRALKSQQEVDHLMGNYKKELQTLGEILESAKPLDEKPKGESVKPQ